MKPEEKLDLLLRTAAMLMGSGANSNRIERSVTEAAELVGGIPADSIHLHQNLRTIMISAEVDGVSFTKFRKVKQVGVNMRVINGIQVSLERLRAARAGADALAAELNRVAGLGGMYPEWLILTAVAAASGAFCTILGGAAPSVIFATLGSFAGIFVRRRMHHAGMNLYLTVFAAALVSCLVAALNLWCAAPISAWLAASGLPFGPDPAPSLAVASCVLYLMPGVPLMNAVDDLLHGYTVMGMSRATVATLTVLAITWGLVVAFMILKVPADNPHLIMLPKWIYALCGGIAAAGFAILFNVPRRVLATCVVGGGIAVLLRALLREQYGVELASAAGALAAGVWGVLWSHRLRVPAAVLSVPAVIPLVPGVFLYKTLLALLNVHHVDKAVRADAVATIFEFGLPAAIIVSALSLGVTLPRALNRYAMHARE